MENNLVNLCIEAATESATAVDKWRRQRRTLERMPFQLGEDLLHRLVRGLILFPSLLDILLEKLKLLPRLVETCNYPINKYGWQGHDIILGGNPKMLSKEVLEDSCFHYSRKRFLI